MSSSTLAFDIIARDMASAVFGKFSNAVKGAGDNTTKAGGKVDGFGGKMGGLVGKLGLAGAAMSGVTLAIKGISDAMSNEVVNDRLAASLGSTPKMAEKMGKISSRLYAGAWGESMDEVAHAVEAAATSFDGLSAGGLQKASRQALDYSKIFEVDLPKATMVAGQAVKTGLAKNATEAFDLMTAASQRVPAALREDVLDAGNEYGQFFASLGFSGEQAFGMLAKGAEKGTYGIDKMGDAIKEFTIRATDGSKASTTAYTRIGLDAQEMSNKIVKGGKGAASATADIVNGLLKIKDPSEQAQQAIALFGTPLEDLNVKDIPDFLRSMQSGAEGMDKFKGSIDRAGETLNDNAATKIEGFKRKMQTTFVDFIGGKVLPAAEKFGGQLRDKLGPTIERVGDWFRSDMMPPLREFAETYAPKARDVVNAMKGAFQDAEPFLRLMGKVLTNVVVPGLKKLVEIAGPALVTQIKAIGKGFEALGKAGTWLWNKALQPAFKFIIRGVADILDMWSSMLSVLGKVPGFGWAKDAATAMGNAAEKARAVADGIKKIPPNKKVTVTVVYAYQGKRNPGKEDGMDILPRGQIQNAQAAGVALMSMLAAGIKKGGKKLDEVLGASRDRIKDAFSTIRDDMASLSESVASAINQTDFSGGIAELMESLTGTGGALAGLQGVFATLKDTVSKGFLSSLMQSGNVGLATALANDPAAAAAASAQFDANGAIAKGLGDATATQVLGDRFEKAFADEVKKLLDELREQPGKQAKKLRKELEALRLEVRGRGMSAGQTAHFQGAW